MKEKRLVSMKGIGKKFGDKWVNEQVEFELRAGEIHALLGENGAGKSTLMNILAGVYKQDAGQLLLHGKEAILTSPKDAIQNGVGMIHQHFKLVENLTASENIILGYKKTFFLNRKNISEEILKFSQKYGLSINPNDYVYHMSVGEKQRIEILKALYRGADILILDEPTAVLTPQETKELFDILRKMADRGCGIVIITHKMKEVMEIADRITVLRKGRKEGTVLKREVDEQRLTEMMIGKYASERKMKDRQVTNEVGLEIENVTIKNDKGFVAVENMSFDVKKGEIVGIAGISGNGQKELAEAIAGLREIEKGNIKIDHEGIKEKNPRQIIDMGLSYVPEDRMGMGLVGNMDITDNLILKDYRKKKARKGIFIQKKKVRENAKDVIDQFEIKIENIDAPIRTLSGGNLQKILLGREILEDPKVLIAAYPVRGLDIATTEAVYDLLLEQRNRGCAVLFISEDLDYIMQLSDRIVAIEGGKVAGIVKPDETTVEEIGMMMLDGQVG
ncbi:ABC transporter ATP-binding protein [Marinisporobacter balticus]|uniref:Nucleoside ABC transporter ATP-binding protein n=1 Tax=Marinisporobacter balticus TaxID=2018667 RepID=A0A4R2KL31_9FIRM|nr:ABC transporter ATP-binding protein [Marinisporobacter balticus]TCO74373.1 nucleoside ABC transporter ATP-binding protein [Marinisporobacter balticus]